MARKIYTKNLAADIVEMFEDVLDKYDIYVPSPEDDERGRPENEAKLYGSVYWDLLDNVETFIADMLEEKMPDDKIITYIFEGFC